MKVAIVTRLFAKGNVNVQARHDAKLAHAWGLKGHSDIFAQTRMHRTVLTFCLLWMTALSYGRDGGERVMDLRSEWKIHDHGEYRAWRGERVTVIYFITDQTTGGYVRLNDQYAYSIFVNQNLIATHGPGLVRLSVDSLQRLYGEPLMFGIFQSTGIRSLACDLVLPASQAQDNDNILEVRKGNYFMDFLLTASCIVLTCLVFLLGTNARHTLEYFNVVRLFTIHEREENLTATRVTSRMNVLFYLFICLFCALTLLVVLHHSPGIVPLSYYFPVRSVAEGFLQWLKLTVILAVLLCAKMAIVFVMAMLFNARDAAVVQFYQFVRGVMFAASLIAIVCLVNFIFHGTNERLFFLLLKIGATVLVMSAGMIYLKLLGITRFHFFHLFSYLCASEIIPLVIILKVLLY